jgi:DNA-binding GntR family transcriptional regulator
MNLPTPINDAIAQLQGNSLAGLVQNEVERMILAGELQPGAKLTESILAAQLGVSRGPVREAFRMLDEAGLVRTEKNRGVFVRCVALEEALEIFELRAVMEMYIGRKLAETCTAAQVKHRHNLAFHDTLLELAGNAKFTANYRRLIKELSLIRRKNLDVESMVVYTREHRQIVKAIAARDAEAAGRAMFDHVMNSRERTLHNFSAAPATPVLQAAPAPARKRAPRAAAAQEA